jgi:hypothetical protein
MDIMYRFIGHHELESKETEEPEKWPLSPVSDPADFKWRYQPAGRWVFRRSWNVRPTC